MRRTPSLSSSPCSKWGKDDNNDDFTSNSISRGAFVFRNGTSKAAAPTSVSGRKRKANSKPLFTVGKIIERRGQTPSKPQSLSYEDKQLLYREHLDHAKAAFERLQRKMFEDVVEAVVSSQRAQPVGVIPTCALLTGVNLPDHEDFFRVLVNDVRRVVSPHVAHLRSAEHGKTNLAMVQATVLQLIDVGGGGPAATGDSSEDDDIPEEDRATEVNMGKSKVKIKRSKLVFPNFENWYSNQYSSGPSPKKRAKLSSGKPLVIVLEDFESFTQNILQDYISALTDMSCRVPVVLILGVATTVAVIHERLPQSVTSHLRIETFSGQKSTQLLEGFIEYAITSDEMPFKLGGNPLNHLLEIFVNDNFSVKNFFLFYKYCLIEHFTTSPIVPKLCTAKKQRDANIAGFSTRDLDHCRKLKSFRRFVQEDLSERQHYLDNDKLLRGLLCDCLDELEAHSARFATFVSGLHALTKDLPGRPLGRQMYSVYRRGLNKKIVESHEYIAAFQFYSVIGATKLKQKLEAFCECLEGNSDPIVLDVLTEARKHLSAMDDWEKRPLAEVTMQSNRTQSKEEDTKRKGKLSMQQLQKKLLDQDLEKRKAAGSSFDSLRDSVVAFFHQTFETHLRPPTQLPFHEVKFFYKATSVARHLMPAPRAVLQTALEDPGFYFWEDGIDGIDEGDSASFPDICTGYRLHAECGKLINVYDWLLGWISMVEPGNDPDDDPQAEVDPVLHARFTQAVSTLQFLGFVKPSKRKADHMTKLTWGGC